jgi:dTMP kinase
MEKFHPLGATRAFSVSRPNQASKQLVPPRSCGATTAANPILTARLRPPRNSVGGCYDAPVPSKITRGRFITIEGLDGCGKSTQLERLAAVLRADGINVIETREPGGTPLSEKVRAVLLDSRTGVVSPRAELALMFGARAQHVDQVILPALADGAWVLCDRFTDSTEAYQGGGRKLGSEPVRALHKLLCHAIQPDLTILMLSEVESSVERARRRNRARIPSVAPATEAQPDENRFEQENRAFFQRVAAAYKAIARREPERVFSVDARREPDIVHREIVAAVRQRLVLGRPLCVVGRES